MLRFNPAAWAKLVYLRDAGPTEIGGFGISSADDPLLVEQVELVAQECGVTSVALDDEAVADFVDEKLDQGIPPAQSGCTRILASRRCPARRTKRPSSVSLAAATGP